jgi:hypothetical protein
MFEEMGNNPMVPKCKPGLFITVINRSVNMFLKLS